MKVLVLGASGQLGRALVATAIPTDALTALNRTECDITRADAIEAAVRAAQPDLVINAAAYTAVDRAESEIEAATALNAVAPGVIARVARTMGARTVHVSTDFVFGGGAGTPLGPTDPTDPLGVYGLTKLEGEQAVAAADSDALIVRTAWVYAAAGANFVNTMLRLMRERPRLTVVADQIGTPTWARSLATGIWGLARAGASGIYHYTDAGVASWYDFAVAIAEEAVGAGLLERMPEVAPIRTSDYPTPARRPAYGVLDKSATWEMLGAPAPHWRANLRLCLRELKDLG